MSERKIGLSFGCLCPPLRKQLKIQSIDVNKLEDLPKWETLRHSISMCAAHGIITDSEREKAYKRLMKMIMKELNK